MTNNDLSESSENYLKAIYRLSEDEDSYIKPKLLMKFLPYAPSTITITLQRLARKGYILYEKYRGVRLTEKGRIRVARILRRHRIFEVFLYSRLNLNLVDTHSEACRVEHVLSDITIDKLDDFLGHPTLCPHGNPIPDRNLNLKQPSDVSLLDVEPGEYVVSRISFETREILAELIRMGIKPNVILRVINKLPKGQVQIIIDNKKYTLPEHIAMILRVKK